MNRCGIVGAENVASGSERHTAANGRQAARKSDVGFGLHVDRIRPRQESDGNILVGLDHIGADFRRRIVLFTVQVVRPREVRPVRVRGPGVVLPSSGGISRGIGLPDENALRCPYRTLSDRSARPEAGILDRRLAIGFPR